MPKKYWIPLVILLSPFWVSLLLVLTGFYVGEPGWAVAEVAVAKRDVNICQKIIIMPWDIFSPQTQDQRNSCIHEYAETMQNPSACNHITSPSYALSCIGGATKNNDYCYGDYNSMKWAEGSSTYSECRSDKTNRPLIGNQCCLLARIRFVRSENDCSPLEGFPKLLDECLDRLAFKQGKSEICKGIEDNQLQIACVLKAKLMKEHPNVCRSCKKIVDTLEELE